jgi:ATP adenylyltransferase/5',5'''-P-1,P-4-tetraphosphate phosphorylase II
MFDGLALGCDIFNTNIIFDFCSRYFDSFMQLMNLYKVVPEVQLLILQYFADIARYAVSTHLIVAFIRYCCSNFCVMLGTRKFG